MTITADQLRGILPHITTVNLDLYLPQLQTILPHYHIDTPQRLGGFLAQCGEESMSFSKVKEDIDAATAQKYEANPALGNKQIGDGVRFKGRGLIQITGRGNYTWCSKDMFGDNRLLINPDLLCKPDLAVQSACWYWTVVKPLNAVCDHPEDWSTRWPHDAPPENQKTYTKIMWMTLLINGGENGLDVRTANYERARQVLGF